jgi:glycosyltransferase involved in cell wall biosynthesis
MAKVFKLGKVISFSGFKNTDEFDRKVELVDVCIFTEGTYPFVKGGVSSVIHQIIENHPHLTFGIVHIAWNKKSPQINLFPKLEHVKWVKTILLTDETRKLPKGDISKEKVTEFMNKVSELGNLSPEQLVAFYNDFINPKTRKADFRKIVTGANFFNAMIERFKQYDISLSELFWLQKEYILLAATLLDRTFPAAKVYHSHTNGYAGLAAAMAAIQHKRRFVLTEHSLYIRDVMGEIENIFSSKTNSISQIRKTIWEKWFSAIGKITYRFSHKSTYLYDKIADDATTFGSAKDRSVIIPNGINYQKFETARKKQEARHSSRFLPMTHWKIGFIGRVVPVKGVKDLIYSIDLLRKQFNQPFQVHVIGPTEEDPKYYKECVELVARLNLRELIIFHGPQDVAKFLEDIDLVVMSSLSEALPVVVLESMAAGVPIISTDVGSVQDIMCLPLQSSENTDSVSEAGVVVPPKSPEELCRGIIQVLNNKQEYERYGQNGPKRILHSFKIEDIMQKYNSLYMENL